MQEGSYRGIGFGRGLAFYEKDGRLESRFRDSGEVSLTKGNQGVSKATERPACRGENVEYVPGETVTCVGGKVCATLPCPRPAASSPFSCGRWGQGGRDAIQKLVNIPLLGSCPDVDPFHRSEHAARTCTDIAFPSMERRYTCVDSLVETITD